MLLPSWLTAVKGRLGRRLRRRVRKTTPENRPAHRVGLYTELLEDRTLLSNVTFEWQMEPRTMADENGRIVMDGEGAALRENEDVKEFYLGLNASGRKSFRDIKNYRRRKRWLS